MVDEKVGNAADGLPTALRLKFDLAFVPFPIVDVAHCDLMIVLFAALSPELNSKKKREEMKRKRVILVDYQRNGCL